MDKKWNLQDIKPASSSRRRPEPAAQAAEPSPERPSRPMARSERRPEAPVRDIDMSTEPSHIDIENGTKKKRRGLFFSSVILGSLFVIVFAISFFMRGADVTVFPQFREPNVNAVFTAMQQAQVGELSYEIMTLEAEGERQVSATGQQSVTEQASGRITIYKSTPGVQRLIKNTRFQDANGRIYRINESVVVPGAVDGNSGNIQADVFADQPGEEYNAPANTRFTVPGLESDEALFNAIYAENTESFTGGFDGQRFIIDETELATAKQALQMELRDALVNRVPGEQPAGFTTFETSYALTYESLPAVEYGSNLATIKEKAILQVPLFRSEDFASYIAAATIPGYEGLPVRIADMASLSFGYTNATTSRSNIANESELEFQLVGRPLIVWTYDAGKLATDLLGINRTALNQVLQAYPAIERARAEIRPFWQRTFPEDLDQINIIESLESDVPGE